jgi:hypothetical protein
MSALGHIRTHAQQQNKAHRLRYSMTVSARASNRLELTDKGAFGVQLH